MAWKLLPWLVVFALVLAACPAPEAPPPAAPEVPEEPEPVEVEVPEVEDPDAITIAFVSHTQDVTDLFGQLKIGFEETLQEHGINYEMLAAAPRDSSDHEGMDRILSDLASVAPDYIVFGPTAFELNQPRLVELEQVGTKVIMTDYPPPEEFDINPLTWVIYDHYEMGRRSGYWAGQYFCDQGVENVNVAMFWGPAASEISIDRGNGVLQGLTEATEECGITYEVVEEVHADFRQDLAFELTERVATAHPDLHLTVGMNSVTAVGIAESLIVQGRLDDVMVIGMGGGLPELAAICRGEIGVAPYRDPRDMGALAAEALILDLEGRNDEILEISWTDMPVLDNCDRVFEIVPRPMLEVPEFADAIPQEYWED